MIINALVEGIIDEAIARKLVSFTGSTFGVCYGKKGIGYINKKIVGFNQYAVSQPFLALIDFMDTGAACPAEAVFELLPHRNEQMLCRVVVREIESWVLADRANLASFLRVSPARIPLAPESINDPKRELVNLARVSTLRSIRNAFVPTQNSGAIVGPLYNSSVCEFINTSWSIEHARANASSLDRCIQRLEALH